MTNNEIVRDWASAKRPSRQIEILAHLNGLSVPKIREILRENGAHVVAKAYSEGATLAQLYKHYGFDKQTIRDMIVSAGVEIRQKGCVVTPAEAPEVHAEPAADTAEAPPAAKPAKRAKQLNPYEPARRFEQLAVAGGAEYDIEVSCKSDKFEARISPVGAKNEVTVYTKKVRRER